MDFGAWINKELMHISLLQSCFQHAARVCCILSLSLLVCGCDGSYNSTHPASRTAREEGALPVYSADARLAYIFSDAVILYSPPCPGGGCAIEYTFGDVVNSYAMEPVSGMPSRIGIPGDITPLDTKSITTAPSGNFLYMLAGDNRVYTFSIGYLTFSAAEFNAMNLDPLKLYNKLAGAGFISGAPQSSGQIMDSLITLLEEPALFDRIAARNPNIPVTEEIANLKEKTVNSRGMLFRNLSYGARKQIVNLNRLMIELVYPAETPKNKGVSALHAVGEPITLPASFGTATSVQVEAYGQFAYVLGSKLGVYAIDQASGRLLNTSTQPVSLGQLIFAPSGLFAYGSTNGSLHTYRIDRSSGMLVELGNAVSFVPWIEGNGFNTPTKMPTHSWAKAPFHNMAADPTGKFLYLIGSAGSIRDPDEFGNCYVAEHQVGSSIYTFIIDINTGLLTPSGPPLNTTPHIMAWGGVDPLGRFVQLINTHEYPNENAVPDPPGSCSGGADTYALLPGNIYSYYVDQASGRLYASGSMAAGGREYPTGFANGGAAPVAITGGITGSFLYLLNAGDMYVYNVDKADGALSVVGSPLTGATATPLPLTEYPKTWPSAFWPSVCFTDSIWNSYCSVTARSHSLAWAGY